MKLLDMINLVMPKLGERPVTSLESKHPTLAIILPIVEQTKKTVLQPGWWFNSYAYTAPLSPSGEVTLGTDTLSFVPHVPDTAVLRGLRLFNPKTFNYVFTAPVSGDIIQNVAFDELPESVAIYIFYASLIEAYTTDLGVTKELSVWSGRAQAAYSDMVAEHLRQKKYSTKRTRNWRKFASALRSY